MCCFIVHFKLLPADSTYPPQLWLKLKKSVLNTRKVTFCSFAFAFRRKLKAESQIKLLHASFSTEKVFAKCFRLLGVNRGRAGLLYWIHQEFAACCFSHRPSWPGTPEMKLHHALTGRQFQEGRGNQSSVQPKILISKRLKQVNWFKQ